MMRNVKNAAEMKESCSEHFSLGTEKVIDEKMMDIGDKN